jgi:hypothetical protein
MIDEGNFNNEKIKKLNFNQFINEKIINYSNKEKEINKNDLIKQIKEKVYNGNNYIHDINSYFNNKNTIKILELENFLNLKNKNKQNTERVIIKNKINFKDLDFLTKDLPEDKNRKKILKPRYTSPNFQNQKNKNLIDSNDLIKELEKLNLPKENTIIKPKNGITNVLNEKKNNLSNRKSFSPILQERVKSKFSSYTNLVQPMNKNKRVKINFFDPISLGIENLKKKISHKKSDSKSFFTNANSNDEDYFFNLYKDYSNQNQSLKILNKKIYKVIKIENEKKNNFVSFSKKDILSSSIDNNKLKSNLLNKIGKAQKNIYTTKEENLNDLNNQYFNSQKILFDIKDEINKLSEGFNDPNKNNSKLSNRIKSLYKLNTEFNDNKNVIEKKFNNDFIQIPINDDNKNINYEFGIQHGNLLNDLI